MTVLVAAGCATSGTLREEPPAPGCYACDELASEPSAAGHGEGSGSIPAESGAPARRLSSSSTADDRFEPRRIGAERSPASAARPRPGRLVTVELKRAPFEEAARLLADAGRFNLVVEAPSATDVTASLHQIEPFDALCAIAEVRGLKVRYERGVVMVSP